MTSFFIVLKISLSSAWLNDQAERLLTKSIKIMKKIFLVLFKYTLVICCAMFGALSLILIEDINVGGSLAFLGVGAGTLVWDAKI